MASLEWSASHTVWLTEIDDEHLEIFEAVSHLQTLLASPVPLQTIREATQSVYKCVKDHFAHEERLMRATRYGSQRWHKQQHIAARKRTRQFIREIQEGDRNAGLALVHYLTSWLSDHSGVADRMMGAFLRNQRRSVCKLTFRAGTKSGDGCTWVDIHGARFDPLRTASGL